MLGIPFAERGRLTDEAIDGIRAAWSDEFGWGDGAFGQRPRPRQPGGPPIWVGGSSPAALRRAGRAGRRLAARRARRRRTCPTPSPRVHGHRAEAGRTGAFTVGALLRPALRRRRPAGWDLGQATLAADADRIRREVADYEAMGVDQVQVRFRSRSSDEYVDRSSALRRGDHVNEVMP